MWRQMRCAFVWFEIFDSNFFLWLTISYFINLALGSVLLLSNIYNIETKFRVQNKNVGKNRHKAQKAILYKTQTRPWKTFNIPYPTSWPLGNNIRSIFYMRIFERWYFGLCWNLTLFIELYYLEGFWFCLEDFFEDNIFAWWIIWASIILLFALRYFLM